MLCALVNGPFNPAPWTTAAQDEFKDSNETIPWYLNTNQTQILNDDGQMRFTNQRLKIERNPSNLVFSSELEGAKTYDAFETDIGIVNIFLGEKTILKYVTSNRMSTLEFIAQIGGSLGLSMGISIISIIEILYWFTFRFFHNAQ